MITCPSCQHWARAYDFGVPHSAEDGQCLDVVCPGCQHNFLVVADVQITFEVATQ